MTRHRYGVCKFAGVIRLSCICVVNHELSASLLKEELQEFDSVAAQAVLVHAHNSLDHSAQDAFQKGKKTFAFESKRSVSAATTGNDGKRFLYFETDSTRNCTTHCNCGLVTMSKFPHTLHSSSFNKQTEKKTCSKNETDQKKNLQQK